MSTSTLCIEQRQNLRSQRATNRSNAIWGIAEYAAQAVSLICLTPLLLKYLGDDSYGLLVIATTIMGLNGLFSLGMGPATQHFVAKYRDSETATGRLRAIVETSIFTNLALGIFACVTILIFAKLAPIFFKEPPSDSTETLLSIIRLSGVALPFVFLANTMDNTLRGFEAFNIAVPIVAMSRVATAISQIVLVLSGFKIFWLIAAAVTFQAIQALIGVWATKRFVIPDLRIRPSFSMAEFKNFFSFGFYVWINSMVGAMRFSGEVLILATILGPAALTIYAVPSRLLTQTHLLLSKTFAYLFPYATKLIASGDAGQIFGLYNTSTRYLCTLIAFAIPPLAVGCGPLLALWLGEETAEKMQPVFQILAVRYAVFPLSILTQNLLMAANQVRAMTVIMIVNTVTILPLSGFLAWKFGVLGAAAAQLSVFLPILFNRFFVERTLFGKSQFQTVLLPVLLITLPLVLSLWMIRIPVDYSVVKTVLIGVAVGIGCSSCCWFFIFNNSGPTYVPSDEAPDGLKTLA